MSYLIGRGRTARETYPDTGKGAGILESLPPLSRYRFIDGGTMQPGLNGSVAEPYQTIAEFTAPLVSAQSVNDATQPVVGILTPSVAGYAESVAFPAYRSVVLSSDGTTQVVTGNATWLNVDGPHAANPFAISGLSNVSLSGTLTLSDDAGAPTSIFYVSGDQFPGSAEVVGLITATTTTKLETLVMFDAVAASGITLGTAATSAALDAVGSELFGPLTAQNMNLLDCQVLASALTIAATGQAVFNECTFGVGRNPILNSIAAGGTAVFDGPSYRSFLEAGGTIGANIAFILVVGGYSGGPNPPSGNAISLAAAAGTVTLNGTGHTIGPATGGNFYVITNVGHNLTLGVGGGELAGDTINVLRTDGTNAAVSVINGGPGAGTLVTFPASATAAKGSAVFQFNGTNWILVQGGAGIT